MAVLPPLIAAESLAAWTGEAITDDNPRAAVILKAVSAFIRGEAATDWPDPAAVPDDVASVAVQAAARIWSNPQGASTERLGDYSYGLPGGDELGGVYFTPTEKSVIRRYRPATGGIGGLGSIATTRGEDQYLPAGYDPSVLDGWGIPAGPGWPW